MNRPPFMRLLGVVVFILIVWAIYALTQAPAASTNSTPPAGGSSATFYCSNNTSIQTVFTSGKVALTLSDGRTFTLPQTRSGSGARYEATSTGKDIVFWNKGNNAFLTENGTTTYADCTAAKVSASKTSGYNTYTDQSKTFSFTFPTDFQVAGSAPGYTQAWSVQATTSGMVLAHIVVPRSYEPGTNFGDANFTVGVSSNPSALAMCLKAPAGPRVKTSRVTIGDIPFIKYSFSDAGAGNRYDTTSYRIIRDNQCYAVEYTIHYNVLQNYPKGTVKAFDEAKVQQALDGIVQSFRFLP